MSLLPLRWTSSKAVASGRHKRKQDALATPTFKTCFQRLPATLTRNAYLQRLLGRTCSVAFRLGSNGFRHFPRRLGHFAGPTDDIVRIGIEFDAVFRGGNPRSYRNPGFMNGFRGARNERVPPGKRAAFGAQPVGAGGWQPSQAAGEIRCQFDTVADAPAPLAI